MDGYCLKCGRQLSTSKICGVCGTRPVSPGVGMQGWECPKCGSVYSPYVMACGVCGKQITTGNSTAKIEYD